MEGLSQAFLLKSVPPTTAEGGGFTSEHNHALGSDIPLCTAATPSPKAELVFVWVTWERQKKQTSSCFFPGIPAVLPANISLLG